MYVGADCVKVLQKENDLLEQTKWVFHKKVHYIFVTILDWESNDDLQMLELSRKIIVTVIENECTII